MNYSYMGDGKGRSKAMNITPQERKEYERWLKRGIYRELSARKLLTEIQWEQLLREKI